MTRFNATFLSTVGLAASLSVGNLAHADDTGLFDWDSYDGSSDSDSDGGSSSGSISEAETSFKGAKMLKGDIDVTIGEITAGHVEDDDNYRYAFFSGNTLYAGVEDRFANTVDMIVEFFWFESSIDRGSDFWVAVVKARTSPNLEEGWRLNVADDPVLSLHAETFNEMDNSGFRWDWSLPFESYGWDAYGNVTLETVYGLGTNAEGSIMTAAEYNEDGVEAEGTIQSKGYFNEEFQVQTKYQITLWRWEMMVQGTPSDMDWDLYLDSWDRQDQNAYHEFFIVMQADEGKGFELERLDLSGKLTDPRWYWWDSESELSVTINNINLVRPEIDLDDYQGGDYGNDDDTDDDEPQDEPQDEPTEDEDADDASSDESAPVTPGDTTNITVEAPQQASGCSTSGRSNSPLGFALALGMMLLGRRRD